MKRSLNRAALGCAVLFLLLPAISRADLISLSISQNITGTLGATPFSNTLVTYTATFTPEQLAACVASGFCNQNGPNDPVFFMDSNQGIFAEWTIEGLGNFVATSNSAVIFHYEGGDHPMNIVVDSGGDVEGRGGLPNPAVDPDCGGLIVCPVEAYTSGGTITFLGVDGPPTFATHIAIETPVPEPSTFVLLGSGVSAMGAALTRRRRSARSA